MLHVYLITDLDTGKQYVGQSHKFRLDYFGSGTLIKKALKKYRGIEEIHEHFKKEIVEVCENQQQLNEREDFWIKRFNTTFPNGYNLVWRGSRPMSKKKSKYEKLLTKGTRFGSWVVNGAISKDSKSRAMVWCKCDCGESHSVYAHQLLNGKTTQCQTCSSGKSDTARSRANQAFRYILGSTGTSSISPNELTTTYSAQNEVCALTGEIVPSYDAAAVRWDNSKDFSAGNTLITSKTVAKLMSGMGGQEFVNFCQQIVDNKPNQTANVVEDFFNRRENDE